MSRFREKLVTDVLTGRRMDVQMERCTDKQEFVGPSPTGIQKYYFLLSFLPPNNDANILSELARY